MRWELEAFGGGTRLTFWTNIDRCFMSMGAAGWHICFDVLDHLLSGTPIGRIAGGEAMKFNGCSGLESVVTWTPTPTSTGTHSAWSSRAFRPDQQQAYQGANYGWQGFFAALEQVLARID